MGNTVTRSPTSRRDHKKKTPSVHKNYLAIAFGCDNVTAMPIVTADNLKDIRNHINKIINDDVQEFKISASKYDIPVSFHSDWMNYENIRVYELPRSLWLNLYTLDNHVDSCYYLIGVFSVRAHFVELDKIMQHLFVYDDHLNTSCDENPKPSRRDSTRVKNNVKITTYK